MVAAVVAAVSRRVQLLFFAVGLAFFIFILRQTGPATVLANLRRTGLTFIPIVLVWGAVYITNTIAWRIIVGVVGGAIPFWRGYTISVASFAINYITPMVSLGGEPFKASAAARWVGTTRATTSVVIFRVVHTLGQFAFWIVALPFAYHELPHTPAVLAGLVAAAVILISATIALVLLMQARLLGRAIDALHRAASLERVTRWIEQRRNTFRTLDERMAGFVREHPRRFMMALAWETIGRFIAMLEFLFIARSVGIDISYPTAVVIGGFSQLILNLFFFIPFELGAKEGGLYLIVRLLGLPAYLGIYAAIVSRLRELAWILIGLLLIWLAGGRRRATLRASLKPEPAREDVPSSS